MILGIAVGMETSEIKNCLIVGLVPPPLLSRPPDEPEVARGSLRMVGPWNCCFSPFFFGVGVGGTIGVGSGEEESF